MKQIFLCGHTGSANHGCEAIVRSTADLLKAVGYKIKSTLVTSGAEQDKKFNLDELVQLVEYRKINQRSLKRYYYGLMKVISHNSSVAQKYTQRDFFSAVKPGDLCFCIGGDTYCYGLPLTNVAMNNEMKKRSIPTVLWCCSVEDTAITNEVLNDLKQYRYIVARESYTINNLVNAGIDKERILYCCDPAFTLKPEQTALPDNFAEDNTIGINISDCVIKRFDETDIVYRNIINVINRIIAETEFNICLIPHVFDAEKRSIDMEKNDKLYEMYKNTGRLSMVEKNYNCRQLKYIISKCRFFFGARTHATIAAYSTAVPTFVLGYSVKSRGIAADIFGTEKGYVAAYNSLKKETELSEMFFNNIIKRERVIKDCYNKTLPKYTNSVSDVLVKLMDEFNMAD